MEQIETNAFMEAIPLDVNISFGENGHGQLTEIGLGDSMLALFDNLIRNVEETKLINLIDNVLEEARLNKDKEKVLNLFVLIMQTRWCRGGKGEKKITYQTLKYLYEDYPLVVLKLIPLLPIIGYWKDPLLLLEECKINPRKDVNYEGLKNGIWLLFATELKNEIHKLEKYKLDGTLPKLSLILKYAPSEGKSLDKKLDAVYNICKILYSDQVGIHLKDNSESERKKVWKDVKSKYRKLLSEGRKILDIPEVKECANKFSEINFEKVASLCLNRKMKAFLNEKLKGIDLRHPDSVDRNTCRENLLKTIIENEVNGKQLFPHELVEKVNDNISTGIVAVINAQWESMKMGVLELSKSKLGKTVFMADVSGSMYGTPLSVAVGLSILGSEICHVAFRDKIMTFSENPQWHDLSKCKSFTEKVQSLKRANWGMNTNFEKAMKQIINIIKLNKLSEEDIPESFMIISDMQMDAAQYDLKWNTVYQNIKLLFHDVGIEISGKPYKTPTIIFWNVRSTEGYPASSKDENVMLLSGYSPSLMKFVISGEMEEEEEIVNNITGEVETVTIKLTPEQTLKKILYDQGLDFIRESLIDVDNELSYKF